jgi:hypothetical protein
MPTLGLTQLVTDVSGKRNIPFNSIGVTAAKTKDAWLVPSNPTMEGSAAAAVRLSYIWVSIKYS